MKIEDINSEDIDINEEYEMVPLQHMMYGYDKMNMMPNMGMPMEYGQYVNPNMGMNSFMGMGQFNYARSMNELTQLSRMYRNEDIDEYEEENEDKMDKYQDIEEYNIPSMSARPNYQYNEVDSVVNKIERYNPSIFKRLTRNGNNYVDAREIVAKIVKVSLMYTDE